MVMIWRYLTFCFQHLVDLAGSERYESSSVDSERLRETTNINTSLSAFGKVVLSLSAKKRTHIPYRDSKLTRILQDRFVSGQYHGCRNQVLLLCLFFNISL